VAQPALLIRELPRDERPRERLLLGGAAALSDAEIVAVLLRTGRAGASAVELARELLRQSNGLGGLQRVSPAALRRRGLGDAKAATVLAALELARRLARLELADREPLAYPEAAARYLALRYALPDQEVMGALFLDTRNRLLAESEVYRGTLNRAAVEPRGLLKEALLRAAAGLVLFHTHPSGDPSPSAEDLAFTRRLAEAGELVGVRLVDHLILGSAGRWVSLRQRGAW
jgi:DNA repair protein RadC